MAQPFLPNLEPLIAAGIDPNTGLPVKLGGNKKTLKEDIRMSLRVLDEQTAVNRYIWYNVPENLTGQDIERMLYYRYQLCFFYNKDDKKFYFMPCALDGSIDFYGRWNRVHPIPWSYGTDEEQVKTQERYLSTIKLDCVYGIKLEKKTEDLFNSCVLLYDYTKQMSQFGVPRSTLNEPILDTMAECIPMMRTSLVASSGIKAVRVNDADQADSVRQANKTTEKAALTGEYLVPVVGTIDFQELTDHATTKAEEYMLAMQSLDNYRLSLYGVDNGGLFQKKAHELQSEADINGGPVGLVMQDGTTIRQNFCNIVNSIWNLGIWCEPAENISGADTDGDGMIYNRNEDGSNSGAEGGSEDDSNV